MRKNEKNFLLTAVNAKFIHSNPAVFSLRACSGRAEDIDILELTINDRYQDLLSEILGKVQRNHTKVIGLSCYIWNTQIMQDLAADLRSILGDEVILFAGGPEASYAPELFLGSCDFVMCWEGEKAFAGLVSLLHAQAGEENLLPEKLPGDMRERILAGVSRLPGIALRTEEGTITITQVSPETSQDIDAIPFLYDHLEEFENRIIYYESSRGCPFRCSYCLSSIDKSVRFRNMDTVKRELQFFIDRKVPQVKFIDRTFNCSHERAQEIWKYLKEHDNGITNFHFEISADLLNEEEISLLSTLRPALVQLEIGIQSTNPDTIRAIRRSMDLERLFSNIHRLRSAENINLHVDLIAGLPYEGYERFAKSFDDVYVLHADQLQLGFLKVLRGTYMFEKAEEYGIRYSVHAPYEVLSTKWLRFEELDRLRRICDVLDLYYNSQQFGHTLRYLEKFMSSPFAFYEDLAEYFARMGYEKKRPAARRRYEVLREFVERCEGEKLFPETQKIEAERIFGEYLRFDQMLHIHKSRRMKEQDVFDFGSGRVVVEVDHSGENPLNHEALWTVIQ